MAKSPLSTDKTDKPEDIVRAQAQAAWEALQPLRQTWEEKEQALVAKVSDSFNGTVVKARVTDAALSTLAFERQARVAAQLPTGKVYPAGKADEGKAKLANIVLQRYIIPNANSQFDMLIKQRLWGVYASVYGSMPMFYDYRVDDNYIGPDCWLVDPRCFLPQPGRNSVQEMDWCMVSTIVSIDYLKNIAKRQSTTWDKNAINKLIKVAEKGKPSRYSDSDKDSRVSRDRYSKELAEGQIELITKYESGTDGHWITFAPDYDNIGFLRDIPNPHKSGRIPIVMRHCFPLMNSIFGLGDFERGMRIQKAKDSIIGLFLEGAKNRIYPPLKMDTSKVTPSSIKYQAGGKWLVSDMNGVMPVEFGKGSLSEFQGTFSSLQSMLMNQFGTTDTTVNNDNSGNPAFGKTPQALKQMESRENARDTWDRFMHEKATEELYEGMINLLAVKMEKPINFTIFEEEIRQLEDEYGEDVLQAFGNYGKLTIAKKLINTEKGFTYIIDSNTSLKKDDQQQTEALMGTWQLAHSSPTLIQSLQQNGMNYNESEHFKAILIASGITDWERILQEGVGMPNPMDPMQQAMPPEMPQEIPPEMQAGLPQAPPEVPQPPQLPPELAQVQPEIGLPDQIDHPINSQDPAIRAVAEQIMQGGQ